MTLLLSYTASLLPSTCTTPRSEPCQKRAARELWCRLTRLLEKRWGGDHAAMNYHTSRNDAEVDADAILDALFWRQASVTLS